MDKKEQRLCRAIKRAGIRASRKEGHLLDREELLQVRVQVMPGWLRLILGSSGLYLGFKAYSLFSIGAIGHGIPAGLAGFLLVCFAIWGIRRTCRAILESMDATASADILGTALEGVAHAIGALFDGL